MKFYSKVLRTAWSLSALCFDTALRSVVFTYSMSSMSRKLTNDLNEDPLRTFLITAKKALDCKFQNAQTIYIVTGNEACDLDSVISAIALSYHNSKVKGRGDAVYLPLLNMERSDFPLRNDIRHVLLENGINDGMLIFRSDIDLHHLHAEKKLSLSLVDFHILPKADESLEDVVTEIIDHRKQEKLFNERVFTLIKPVGSCSTLVAGQLFASKITVPKSLVTLLYSAIIADTICMSETAGKKTRDDEVIVKKLEDLDPLLVNRRQDIFDKIRRARTDVSSLKLPELLRKDLKIISSTERPHVVVAMSSIEESLQKFLQRSEIEANITDFLKLHNAAVSVLMFLSTDEENHVTRQIAVYSINDNLRKEICRLLEDSRDPVLHLSKVGHSLDSKKISIYNQGNEKASRKAVLPIIKEHLNTLTKFLV